MRIEFNRGKDAENQSKHGISLARAQSFDFRTALEAVDTSQHYGETRIIAIGFLDAKPHVLVYTEIAEGVIRAISLRAATAHERMAYGSH